MEELVKYMRALVFLQLQGQSDGAAYAKPEVLLQKAGFKAKEIADLLGKKESAVAKSLSRANASIKEAMSDECPYLARGAGANSVQSAWN